MYSQHREDLFIVNQLSNNNKIGSILDIGANDGTTYSNSRYFIEKLGWKGVLVEPTSQCISKLNELYSENNQVIIYPYAIDSEETETVIYLGNLEPDTINQVSTMSTSEKAYWETNRNVHYTEELIKTKTIDQLVSDIKIDYFDIISIDTEGKDILAFSRLYELGYRPEFFIFEHNSNNITIQQLSDICHTEYRIVWKNTINFILQKI
jgi:FkbM family methyltransferase